MNTNFETMSFDELTKALSNAFHASADEAYMNSIIEELKERVANSKI